MPLAVTAAGKTVSEVGNDTSVAWRTVVKRTVKATALVLGGVAVTLVLIEVTARVFQMGPSLDAQYGGNVPDPFVPYRGRPFVHITGRSDEFTFDYRHNSGGFRDTEHTLDKPPGVFRIVALGDSFTYGVGAAFDETYPARVERLLNQQPGRTQRVEIINLGLPMYGTEAERLMLEHYGLPYHPDLVLVGFLPNDIADAHAGLDAISVRPDGFLSSHEVQQFGTFAAWLSKYSRGVRFLLIRIVAFERRGQHTVDVSDVHEIYKDHGLLQQDWRKVESELTRIQSLAKQHGAGFVLVSIPQAGPWDAEQAYPDQRLAGWSAAHGAMFIPTLPALRGASVRPLYFPKDGHCTPAGYAVIARAIVSEFERLRVVH
jgi:lysophospholipase L1-like esterase